MIASSALSCNVCVFFVCFRIRASVLGRGCGMSGGALHGCREVGQEPPKLTLFDEEDELFGH